MNHAVPSTAGDRVQTNTAKALFVLCPVTQGEPGNEQLYLQDGTEFFYMCLRLGIKCDVMAVNRAIHEWPCSLQHAASLHEDYFRIRIIDGKTRPGYLDRRARAGLPMEGIRVHGPRQEPGVNQVWKFERVPSSGAFAVFVGRSLGYQLVVTNVRLADPAGTIPPHTGYAMYQPKWKEAAQEGWFQGVKTFNPASGQSWVSELLGECTEEDLKTLEAA